MPPPSKAESKYASEVPITSLDGKKRVYVYETETGIAKTYRTEALRLTKDSAILKIPVQKGTTRVALILPGDEAAKIGPVQIASVPIPFRMAVRRSIFGKEMSIYAMPRV